MSIRGTLQIPSKVFLIGEYAVVRGGDCVMFAIEPYFEWKKGDAAFTPAPESAAGRIWSDELTKSGKSFIDPYQSQGGFGASGAHFITAALENGLTSIEQVLELYHRMHEDLPDPPSGSDMAVQWEGGAIRYAKPHWIEDLTEIVEGLPLLVFSATSIPGRKLATHVALENLAEFDSEPLETLVYNSVRALRAHDHPELGRILTEYAEELARLGLETEPARKDREFFRQFPGVLGVKGTGAGLNDAVLVLYSDLANVDTLVSAARERGLKLITRELRLARGVRPE